MREIKFRGFHADEHGKTIIKLNGKEIRGEWYKGDLSTGGGYYIKEHSVIPETIGQYVNKKDKNHKELFEGDIVGNERIIGLVFYEERDASFVLKWKNTDKHRKDFFKTCYLSNYSGLDKLKIIGNIYEAPELLEVAE